MNSGDQSLHSWLLIELEVATEAYEQATSILFEAGSIGTVILAEHPNSMKVGAYFDGGNNPHEVLALVKASLVASGWAGSLQTVNWSRVEDEDWMQRWKEGFEPIEIGERLVVAPSWKIPSEKRGRVLVQMDPGMAFGTGTHDTTRLCLLAIERYWHGKSLLDVGTGTGILAIAAALLEPGSRITAIDIDPVATSVAFDNASINSVSHAIDIMTGATDKLAGRQFDVVVANLTAEVIVDNIRDLASSLRSGGIIILSGILATLVPGVGEGVEENHMRVLEQNSSSEWSAIIAEKQV